MKLYVEWGSPVCTTFLKMHSLTTLSVAFFDTDHDGLIQIYIFTKNVPPLPTFVLKNNMGGQKSKYENHIK